MSTFKEPVFYVPSNGVLVPQIIDTAKLNNDGVYMGVFSHETLQQVNEKYPGALVGEMDDVIAAKEAMLISDPSEISEDIYWDALEVLPPEGWVNHGNEESFKLCERISGRITDVYARIGSRYFHFKNAFTITHAEIIKKVTAHLENKTTEAA